MLELHAVTAAGLRSAGAEQLSSGVGCSPAIYRRWMREGVFAPENEDMTARMGLVHHLSAAEIIAQVLVARHVLGWQVDNLVFMGMGEALDNQEALLQALAILTDGQGLAFAAQ